MPVRAAGRSHLGENGGQVVTGHLRPRNRRVGGGPRRLQSQAKGTAVGAERDRVAGFGRLEDGLRQASDWYLWGPDADTVHGLPRLEQETRP
jgi:hypothetical protein